MEEITGRQEEISLERNNPCLWPEAGGFCASLLAGAGRARFAAGSRRTTPSPSARLRSAGGAQQGHLQSARLTRAAQPRYPRPARRAPLPRRLPSR